jgi:hypothetical protein
VIIAAIELKGATVGERVKLMEVRQLTGDRDGAAFPGLAIQDLNLVPLRLERGCKIGQTDRLGPNGGLIKIANRGLDEEDLHGQSGSTRNTIMK